MGRVPDVDRPDPALPHPALRRGRQADDRQLRARRSDLSRCAIPSTQSWTKDVARALDKGFNALVGAPKLDDYVEPQADRLAAWPEAVDGPPDGQGDHRSPQRARPDSGHFRRGAGRAAMSCSSPTTTAPSPGRSGRSAPTSWRRWLAVLLISLLLSSFLARTIVRPLRRLALAAHRVRLGRVA